MPPLFQDSRRAARGAVFMFAITAAIFTMLAIDRGLLQPIDDWWLRMTTDAETGLLVTSSKVLDVVGGSVITWPLWAAVGAYLTVTRRWMPLAIWVLSIGLAEAAVSVSKAIYERPRPAGRLVDTSGSAFPSGHSAAAAVTAVTLVIVLLAPGTRRRIWEAGAGLFAFAVAMSRTVLRVHWLSDVVAGALLGAAVALAVGVAAEVAMLRRSAATVGFTWPRREPPTRR